MDCPEPQFLNALQHTRSRTVVVSAIRYHRFTLVQGCCPGSGIDHLRLAHGTAALTCGSRVSWSSVQMRSTAQQRPGELFRCGVQDAEALASPKSLPAAWQPSNGPVGWVGLSLEPSGCCFGTCSGGSSPLPTAAKLGQTGNDIMPGRLKTFLL